MQLPPGIAGIDALPRVPPAFARTWDVKPFYATEAGFSLLGDSTTALRGIPDGKVDLIVTSPPYALQNQKEYGNVDHGAYVKWFQAFVPEFKRVLSRSGSLVINIGGTWKPGEPTRSVYHYELLIALAQDPELHFAQEFFWYNPAKMPNPAQWVNIDRIRVKDAVEPIWWFVKDPKTKKPNNRRVLTAYTKHMQELFKNGYNAGKRPSGWVVKEDTWSKDNGGAIPPNFLLDIAEEDLIGNVLAMANTDSQSPYMTRCRELNLDLHPARFPRGLPEFFINFLTEENDLVLDPFAGSNLTGEVAQARGRRWIAVEKEADYAFASGFRFDSVWNAIRPPPPPTQSGGGTCAL